MFLSAEPHRIGTHLYCRVASRMPCLISASVISSPSRNLWARSSSTSETASSRCSRHVAASSASSAGISVSSNVLPRSSRQIERLHPDEVDEALERVLDADRDLDRHGLHAQALGDHVDVAPEVGAGAVELVDEADARHAVAVGLAPDRLGLGLDAGHAVEDHDRAVEHAQAALHLDGEVHVPGRIDNVDAVIVPRAGRRRGSDRDAALLLLGHPVHGGRALMDLTDLVDLLRVEEDPLGDGRLARVDMRDDSDVPRSCERNGACHGVL